MLSKVTLTCLVIGVASFASLKAEDVINKEILVVGNAQEPQEIIDYAISIPAAPGIMVVCGIDDDFRVGPSKEYRQSIILSIATGFSKQTSNEMLASGKLIIYSNHPVWDNEGNARIEYGRRILYAETEQVDGTKFSIKHDGVLRSTLRIKKRELEKGTLLKKQLPIIQHISQQNITKVSFPIAIIDGKTRALSIFITKDIKPILNIVDIYDSGEKLSYKQLLGMIVPVRTAPKIKNK